MERIASSFRDPNGFLYRDDNDLLRQVTKAGAADYDAMMDKLYSVLVEKGLLIPHEEVDTARAYSEDVHRVLRPDIVPFISYPYEWSFAQLQDAALLTLRIQKIALRLGFTLKDASAYNIQFIGAKPIFIDTLSFTRYQSGQTWDAYRQFCQHFLAPLALAAHTDANLMRLLRTYIDGIPLPLASRLLPSHTYLRLGYQMHLHLHARSILRYENPENVKTRQVSIDKKALLRIVSNLKDLIESMSWQADQTHWADYYDGDSYEDTAFAHKQELVHKHIKAHQPSVVWDMGANIGAFSALTDGAQTVAWDFDMGAVQRHYKHLQQKDNRRILPLVQDLTNPSPAIGWMNEERGGLFRRATDVEMVMALALIHHIVIGNNVLLGEFARFLAEIAPLAIVEFVPKTDKKVQRLLAAREDIFPDYHIEGWEAALAPYFKILDKSPIQQSERMLYLLQANNRREV